VGIDIRNSSYRWRHHSGKESVIEKRYTKYITTALLVILAATAIFPIGIFAIANGDNPPSINAVEVFTLEDGGVGVLIDYFLDYTLGNPTETATEAYLGVFIDIDGTTQLKSGAPYAFDDDGYGRGIIWLRFTAAEAETHTITIADEANYVVWVTGNPTLVWDDGDPDKMLAGIDDWTETAVRLNLALRVLHYASVLETVWTENLVENTALGDRLTTMGEAYFEGAIPGLRTLAPTAFSVGESTPENENPDYTMDFGATMTDGTGAGGGTVVGSPITLVEGVNSVNVTVVGTFILELTKGTVGTAVGDTGTVTGDPVALVYGTNTITVPVAGDGLLTVTVDLVSTQTNIIATMVEGTALDMTEAADLFNVSTMMFSGMAWLLVSIVICAAVAKTVGLKSVLLIFDVCIIGGAVLGLIPLEVATLMFIAFIVFTAYILFFRGANV